MAALTSSGQIAVQAILFHFLSEIRIELKTSSHYPQSNGLAILMLKVSMNLIKRLFYKQNLYSLEELHPFLSISSLAEIQFSRKFVSDLMYFSHQFMKENFLHQRTDSKRR